MEDLIKQIQEQLGKFLVWLLDTAPVPMKLIYDSAKLMNVFVLATKTAAKIALKLSIKSES